jgi:hypothetical protein
LRVNLYESIPKSDGDIAGVGESAAPFCTAKSGIIDHSRPFGPNNRAMKLLAGFLVIFAGAVQPQSIHELFGTDKFHRAYIEANTHELTFEPFQELNWEAKARTGLPWLNLDRPTPSQIARLSTFESAGPQFRSVDFRAPLDSTVSQVTYLLICADGIIPLRPVQFKGSVSFDFDASISIVQRKVASGVIVGRPSRRATTAAFVVIGKPADVKDVHFGAKFEKRNQSGAAVYDFIDGSRRLTWATSSTEQPEAAFTFSFRLAGQQLLLVKWNSDFCGSVYTLFTADTELKPIASNDYDCDT